MQNSLVSNDAFRSPRLSRSDITAGAFCANFPPATRSALIIGGSIAGQLAAAAMVGHGFSVTILDRDHLPDAALPRKGLPQARHLHGLMVGGQRSLEALL